MDNDIGAGTNRFRESHLEEVLPREQMMLAQNPRQVPDEALLAILLRTGTRGCDVLELSRRLIGVFGSLKALMTSDWRTIEARVCQYNRENPKQRLLGFGRVKCLELSAAFELGYRRQRLSLGEIHRLKVRNADDAYAIFRPCFNVDDEQENVFVLPLDADRRPICEPFLVSRGTTDGTVMHPREIFKHAIRWGANAIVVAHNHPCGNPTPSKKDIERTKELAAVADIVGVKFFDHLVIGSPESECGRGYVSIRGLSPN